MKIYRKIISIIDFLILILLKERMRVALKIEKKKRKDNLPIYFPEVEEKKISVIRKKSIKQKLNPNFTEKIFREIMRESVRIQEEQRKRCSRC